MGTHDTDTGTPTRDDGDGPRTGAGGDPPRTAEESDRRLVGDGGETVTRQREVDAPPVTEVADRTEPVRELGHEEFDPVGTASLIAVYLAILVVMWLFMYFVEFLGRGPTVIG